ncbi:hypothetical protein HDU76_002281 [Blyttiomyces sp. JEL0837]|nr:hypothetical protein HDU76_002281 [Blyttiomyces sp. JEL0837]
MFSIDGSAIITKISTSPSSAQFEKSRSSGGKQQRKTVSSARSSPYSLPGSPTTSHDSFSAQPPQATRKSGSGKRNPEDKEARKQARAVRNRISAQISRDRKRKETEELQHANEILQQRLLEMGEEKMELMARLNSLASMVSTMQTQLTALTTAAAIPPQGFHLSSATSSTPSALPAPAIPSSSLASPPLENVMFEIPAITRTLTDGLEIGSEASLLSDFNLFDSTSTAGVPPPLRPSSPQSTASISTLNPEFLLFDSVFSPSSTQQHHQHHQHHQQSQPQCQGPCEPEALALQPIGGNDNSGPANVLVLTLSSPPTLSLDILAHLLDPARDSLSSPGNWCIFTFWLWIPEAETNSSDLCDEKWNNDDEQGNVEIKGLDGLWFIEGSISPATTPSSSITQVPIDVSFPITTPGWNETGIDKTAVTNEVFEFGVGSSSSSMFDFGTTGLDGSNSNVGGSLWDSDLRFGNDVQTQNEVGVPVPLELLNCLVPELLLEGDDVQGNVQNWIDGLLLSV